MNDPETQPYKLPPGRRLMTDLEAMLYQEVLKLQGGEDVGHDVESGVVKDRGRGWKAWARKPPYQRLLGRTRRFKLWAALDRKKLKDRLK